MFINIAEKFRSNQAESVVEDSPLQGEYVTPITNGNDDYDETFAESAKRWIDHNLTVLFVGTVIFILVALILIVTCMLCRPIKIKVVKKNRHRKSGCSSETTN